MSKTIFVRISACFFTIAGLFHLYRALNAIPAKIVDWPVPVIASWVVGLIALFLGYTGYRHWN